MAGTNKRTYRARAKSWGLAEASTGKEQVVVEFAVLTEGASHESLNWYGYFTDATFERTLESLRYCGWNGDDLLNLAGLDKNEVDLVVEDEEYEGKVTARVQWVNRAGGLAIKTPLAGEKAAKFAVAMRDRIRAIDAAKGIKKPAAAKPAQGDRPEPPPLTDADIPF